MKVVEYWHGTIKNYRYDGDVSYTFMLALDFATVIDCSYPDA